MRILRFRARERSVMVISDPWSRERAGGRDSVTTAAFRGRRATGSVLATHRTRPLVDQNVSSTRLPHRTRPLVDQTVSSTRPANRTRPLVDQTASSTHPVASLRTASACRDRTSRRTTFRWAQENARPNRGKSNQRHPTPPKWRRTPPAGVGRFGPHSPTPRTPTRAPTQPLTRLRCW